MLDGYICPRCGAVMIECIGAQWTLECESCGAKGGIDYDEDDNEYVDIFDFYDDPFSEAGLDMPEACRACGGPYPDCTSSCKIFDD